VIGRRQNGICEALCKGTVDLMGAAYAVFAPQARPKHIVIL